MALWHGSPTLDDLARAARGTMLEHLSIEFQELGDEHLVARMPVDARTHQPYGLLHGGASAALAESLGSVASWLVVDAERQRIAGVELNVSHLRPVARGHVIGRCTPIRIGRSLHVWDIRIADEAGRAVAVSRLTVAVLPSSS